MSEGMQHSPGKSVTYSFSFHLKMWINLSSSLFMVLCAPQIKTKMIVACFHVADVLGF
jgi:hypothetical protein